MKKVLILSGVLFAFAFTSCKKEPPLPPQPQVTVDKDDNYGNQTVTGSRNDFILGSWTVKVEGGPARFRGVTIVLDSVNATSVLLVRNFYNRVTGVDVDMKSSTLAQPVVGANDFYTQGSANVVLSVNASYRIRAFANIAPGAKVLTRIKVWYEKDGQVVSTEFKEGQLITCN